MFFDILIVLAFLLCIVVGAFKGFAKTVMGLCSYVISIILGLVFFDPFKNAVYSNTFFADNLELFRGTIEQPIEEYVVSHTGNMPIFLENYIRSAGSSFAEGLSNIVVEAVLAVVFVILLIVATKLLAWIITLVVKLPVLKQFNCILGGAVGAINGIIVCYILGAVLIFALTASGNSWVAEQIDTSFLAAYFFKNNFILNLLMSL